MINITGVYVPELLSEETMERMRTAVSEERRQQSLRFQRQQDAQRSLLGELLVLYILQERYQLPADTLTFSKNSYGKPYLSEHTDIHFNLSHAGDWVICADGNVPVGADIERVRPIDFAIAERFFTASEYKLLMNTAEQDRLQLFYTLWTLKESYIKFIGKGLSIPLDSFSIELIEPDRARLAAPDPEEDSSGGWDDHCEQTCFFRKINLDREHQLSVCSAVAFGPRPLIMVDWSELLPEHNNYEQHRL
ncbi:4'-phosphopantetheinyl transferase family protein [Paenibacillus campi]|uniref:4'-phosphopantetheinyl transferase family protein n=2 Tax=Paenibacillus campi TaxID=3106031 RepID=UPI002AFF3225|nr:4'-phosphopantetheinyl transferase superfamily protein [Paenibacillus sp. SGZ-1014]